MLFNTNNSNVLTVCLVVSQYIYKFVNFFSHIWLVFSVLHANETSFRWCLESQAFGIGKIGGQKLDCILKIKNKKKIHKFPLDADWCFVNEFHWLFVFFLHHIGNVKQSKIDGKQFIDVTVCRTVLARQIDAIT